MSIPYALNPFGRGYGEPLPPSNEIWYWAPEQITLASTSRVASHTFANGKGVVSITPGTTSILMWFSGKSTVTKLYFADTFTTMDDNGDCQNLTNLTKVRLPRNLTYIGAYAFRLSNIPSLKIPESVTQIGYRAFLSCSSLTELSIPAAVSTIEDYAFYNIVSLAKVTFMGTPTSIGSNIFGYCGSLAHIYVPWSEGEVAGAPWGANNATIHYNCTN